MGRQHVDRGDISLFAHLSSGTIFRSLKADGSALSSLPCSLPTVSVRPLLLFSLRP